ncbi:MAG: M15 family metallopeptidase [Caulobacteraceae bacterium]
MANSATAAASAGAGSVVPVDRRDTDPLKLHPVVRAAVSAVLETLHGRGVPFQVFEAFRAPERQAWLYAQGRTRPGGIVTKAQAWQSYHQYGLAVDLVLFRQNAWSWSTAGADAGLWTMMHDVAQAHGLRPLSFEAPHVEFAGPDWKDLQQGRGFPPDGNATWLDAVSEAASRWSANHGAPAAPPLHPPERPALPDGAE